ncbi:zinc finger protein 675-like [Rhopalosiphum padi]|uniref:zinc finger protein 675-like n=1 Tax=Rhopalosiphum padi TaxID=40932 RepID=UPI00298E7C2A|nr:zinc finger protein 675-like [Rhopalosiphum padi]XP_060846508.1 zinc finger protein 675-like [Rhopalosiphum padi]
MAEDDPPDTVNILKTEVNAMAVNHSSSDTDPSSSDEDVENIVDDTGSIQSTDNSDIDPPFKYHCNECDLSFKYNCWFKRHMVVHNLGTYACEYCTKLFKRKDSMREHLQLHLGGPKHKCQECGKEFGDKRNMNKHIKSIHQKSMVKCLKCDKMYSNKRQLRYHDNRVHTLEKPYKCNNCGDAFPVPCLLSAHRVKMCFKILNMSKRSLTLVDLAKSNVALQNSSVPVDKNMKLKLKARFIVGNAIDGVVANIKAPPSPTTPNTPRFRDLSYPAVLSRVWECDSVFFFDP